jgi:hypothetical protein
MEALMDMSELGKIAPSKLAQLLDVEEQFPWSGEDAGRMLRYQFDAKLLPELYDVRGVDPVQLRQWISKRPAGETFLQHLLSVEPSLEILSTIKSWSRQIRDNRNNPVHGDPASVIYFAAIAAALVRFRTRITSLNDEQLAQGVEWAGTYCTTKELQTLFNSAMEGLRSGQCSP